MRDWYWLPVRFLGGVMIGAGALALIHSFARFVSDGVGTPAPVAPTERLVVGGLYRYVRNPMYLGRVVKFLGDGAMLHFDAAIGAVRRSLDLIGRIPSPDCHPRTSGSTRDP